TSLGVADATGVMLMRIGPRTYSMSGPELEAPRPLGAGGALFTAGGGAPAGRTSTGVVNADLGGSAARRLRRRRRRFRLPSPASAASGSTRFLRGGLGCFLRARTVISESSSSTPSSASAAAVFSIASTSSSSSSSSSSSYSSSSSSSYSSSSSSSYSSSSRSSSSS